MDIYTNMGGLDISLSVINDSNRWNFHTISLLMDYIGGELTRIEAHNKLLMFGVNLTDDNRVICY